MLSFVIGIAGILLTIFFVVGVHEFGHFFVARLVGIKVLRFSMGFGKALFRWHDKKGTEYVIAAIPLGGYVKMLDENEDPVDKSELHLAYNRQPVYKRAAVVIAGPFFNLLFAFLLYWLMFIVGFTVIVPVIGKITPHSIAADAGLKPNQEIVRIDNKSVLSWTSISIRLMPHIGEKSVLTIETKNPVSSHTQSHRLDLSGWQVNDLQPEPLESLGIIPLEPVIPSVITKIEPNSPAAKSSLKPADKIISINDQPINSWNEAMAFITLHPDQSFPFTIKRNGKIETFFVNIGSKTRYFKKFGYLGIETQFEWPLNLRRHVQYRPIEALSHALQNTYDFTYLNFLVFEKMLTGKMSLKSLGGPITIFASAGGALNSGLLPFVSFLAFLSISIGIINILPIPGLDGGHLLFQFIEFAIRRPIPLRIQFFFYRLGIILLFLLITQALVNDILRL